MAKIYDVSTVLKEETFDLFQEFLKTLRTGNSKESYARAVAKICTYCRKDFLELGKSDIEDFFSYLEQDMKSSSISVYYYSCHSFAEYAQGVVDGYFSPFLLYHLRMDAPDYKDSDFPPVHTLSDLLCDAGQGTDLYLAILLALRLCLTITEIISLSPLDFTEERGKMYLSLVRNPAAPPSVMEVPEEIRQQVLLRRNRNLLLLNSRGKALTARTLRNQISSLGTGWTFRSLRAFGTLLILDAGVSELDVAQLCGVSGRWLNRYRGIAGKGDYTSAAVQALKPFMDKNESEVDL